MSKVVAALMCIAAAAPLVAAVLGFAFESFRRQAASYWLAVLGGGIAMVAGAALVTIVSNPMLLPQDASQFELFHWLQLGGSTRFDVSLALRVDSFAALLIMMISAIAAAVLVHGKQRRHEQRQQYFPCLSLSLFAAVMVVLSANLIVLYFFWQLGTVATLLLQNRGCPNSDESTKPSNLFFSLVVADVALLLGVCFVWTSFRTLEISEVLTNSNIANVLAERPAVVGTICFCFLVAAFSRCAQFPLFVWLHDTETSRPANAALFQGATLMPAGIYLVLRCNALFSAAADMQLLMALLGGLSVLLLSFIAIGQQDLRRVLGLSSALTLGFSFLALSIDTFDAIKAAVVLLLGHSLAKAVLFLAADNIAAHCDGTTKFERLGGLRRQFPKSWWASILALLVLVSGVWGQSGILLSLSNAPATDNTSVADVATDEPISENESSQNLASVAGTLVKLVLISGFMHSLAVFRAFFLTFHGRESSESTETAREATASWFPMFALIAIVLAVGVYSQFGSFDELLLRSFWNADMVESGSVVPSALSFALSSALGIVIAWMAYANPSVWPQRIARVAGPFSRLSRHGLYIEEFYCSFLARSIKQLSIMCRWVDRQLFQGLGSRIFSRIADRMARTVRPLQTGNIQMYVLSLLLMIALLAMTLLWSLE